ncbi:MAG: tyrosine--tRNA ligase [Phenylobacterium sp.]|uniref:tyrosine--tRNA ligase n=1 Tax=Phenylobacterium sp. TaxID=1871053 RepID=UPI0025D400CF|nr:tyrosine--tRNA ligase [Phenylobacterium sp.]MCA6334590.1 tyrosine--tRNA ligase [Phenylobacterium sp.]
MLDRLLDGVAIVEPKDGLQQKLALAEREGRRLVVKLGFDPTAPDLHLGHAVVLEKLRQFQDAGHRVVVIIGDFTAAIGDPTGRNKMRPPLSEAAIEANSATYIAQLSRVVDTSRIEIRRNSEWLSRLDFRAVIELVSKLTVAQIMQRDDFRKRFDGGVAIHFHELLYPIMQGYDSVIIDADIELGGTDQLFNNLVGRALQESHGKPGQVVITCPLLVGLDGVEKMSKSKNNYLGLTAPPEDMYGKVMSIADSLIPHYLDLTTTYDHQAKERLLEGLAQGANPMAIKKQIAANVVERFYPVGTSEAAAAHFERTVQNRAPDDADHAALQISRLNAAFPTSPSLLDLCDFATEGVSRSQLRRLIHGGGVSMDRQKIMDEHTKVQIAPGRILWVGKRSRYILTGD